jgi:hypothetical protein
MIEGEKIYERILKKKQKRVEIPQKYIEKRVLQGVNQKPKERIARNKLSKYKQSSIFEWDLEHGDKIYTQFSRKKIIVLATIVWSIFITSAICLLV